MLFVVCWKSVQEIFADKSFWSQSARPNLICMIWSQTWCKISLFLETRQDFKNRTNSYTRALICSLKFSSWYWYLFKIILLGSTSIVYFSRTSAATELKFSLVIDVICVNSLVLQNYLEVLRVVGSSCEDIVRGNVGHTFNPWNIRHQEHQVAESECICNKLVRELVPSVKVSASNLSIM